MGQRSINKNNRIVPCRLPFGAVLGFEANKALAAATPLGFMLLTIYAELSLADVAVGSDLVSRSPKKPNLAKVRRAVCLRVMIFNGSLAAVALDVVMLVPGPVKVISGSVDDDGIVLLFSNALARAANGPLDSLLKRRRTGTSAAGLFVMLLEGTVAVAVPVPSPPSLIQLLPSTALPLTLPTTEDVVVVVDSSANRFQNGCAAVP